MNRDLVSYYHDRAQEYDKVYSNPLEQEDLRASTILFQDLFAQKKALEIACGTGYWTERIAQTAASVLATDVNKSMLEIARVKRPAANIRYAVADMYALAPEETFEGLFGGFIWSHILRQDLDALLDTLKGFLQPGAPVAFIDGNAGPDERKITHTDEYGNTWQSRSLDNGAPHLVLKNFPTKDFLVQKLSRISTDIQVVSLPYYWIATCKVS